ncbi:translation initiation factor IF-2 [Streptomyces seoulensis]|nr:translation initiation factor IF-2 [Streptomyces seoulensis]
MAGKGSGGGTSFEGMSHEQMLAWLDQASSGEVQAAAGRLATAATEIQRIAEQLKLRPQVVEWKGEGADAFRSWANELANSSLRLADFSKAAGVQLGHASDAIATAQASIPRDTKGAQANLDAATAAHNDPDSAAIRAKSASELAALKADREKVRQEAADQMRKLAQSYQVSTTQMNGLARPKFPPPPKAIRPPSDGTSEDLARPGNGTGTTPKGVQGGGGSGSVAGGGGSGGGSGTTGPTHRHAVVSSEPHAEPPRSRPSVPESGPLDHSRHSRPPTPAPSPHVGVDSVGTPPGVHPEPSTGPAHVPSVTTRPDPGPVLPTTGSFPPMAGGTARRPSASGQVGKQFDGGRGSGRTGVGPVGSVPGRGTTGAGPTPGRNLPTAGGVTGRPVPGVQQPTSGRAATSGSGITGGRPSTTGGTGRQTGRVPGGALGGEPAGGRGSTARTPITGQPGQPGQPGRTAARTTGPTGGRAMPSARDGIVGGTQQRPGRTPARPGAPLPSAPTRGGISGGVPSGHDSRGKPRNAAGGSTAGARKRRDKRDDERRDERPTTD